MHIFKQRNDLEQYLNTLRIEGKSIGFVPTMGALHEGHISLIKASKLEASFTVCSIFVNPTQFNDPLDLEKYPRTLPTDIQLLILAECDILFAPDVEDIYGQGENYIPRVNLGYAGEVMEAKQRPGHFEGVMQVVYRLLDIVKPNLLFMGLKDYQQQLIIGKMIEQYQIPTILRSMPTGREVSGLARSSRNKRISERALSTATVLYKMLQKTAQLLPSTDLNTITQQAIQEIEAAGLQVEYFEIADAKNLKPVHAVTVQDKIVICVAAWIEGVRLVDNIIWENK